MEYILVADGEFNDPCEVELEEDGTLSFSTLSSEFGDGVTGLSYLNPETGNRRIVRLNGTVFRPPRSGWSIASSSAGLTFATRAQVQPEKKQLSKKELLSLQEKYPLARNAVRNWNCLNTTIRRLVHGQQWHGSGGMTKCEGTTTEQSLLNRKLREAIATDSRVTRLFTKVEIGLEDRVGVVLLDETYAVNQVRNCVNSMKKTGSWEAPIMIKQEPQDECKENKRPRTEPADVTGNLDELSNGAREGHNELQEMSKGHKTSTRLSKKRKVDVEETRDGTCTLEDEGDSDDSSKYVSPYEALRLQRIEENKQFLLQTGLAPLSDKDLTVVAKAWFPPEVSARLNVGKVLGEIQALGLLKPKRCGLTKTLAHFGRELIENKLVRVTKTSQLTRSSVEKL